MRFRPLGGGAGGRLASAGAKAAPLSVPAEREAPSDGGTSGGRPRGGIGRRCGATCVGSFWCPRGCHAVIDFDFSAAVNGIATDHLVVLSPSSVGIPDDGSSRWRAALDNCAVSLQGPSVVARWLGDTCGAAWQEIHEKSSPDTALLLATEAVASIGNSWAAALRIEPDPSWLFAADKRAEGCCRQAREFG